MKKFFALLLSLVVTLSLIACGDNREDKTGTKPLSNAENGDSLLNDSDKETENKAVTDDVEVSDELINFLSRLSLVEPTDAIIGTHWEFSGGMVDGTEMSADEAAQSLKIYDSKLNIVFDDGENVSMVQNGRTLKGIYRLTEDRNVLNLVFGNAGSKFMYAGLFADVNGTLVMLLFPDGSGKNIVYFTQISEQ